MSQCRQKVQKNAYWEFVLLKQMFNFTTSANENCYLRLLRNFSLAQKSCYLKRLHSHSDDPPYQTKPSLLSFKLLNKNPEVRLGMPDCPSGDLKKQRFFTNVDWKRCDEGKMMPPFKPLLVSV